MLYFFLTNWDCKFEIVIKDFLIGSITGITVNSIPICSMFLNESKMCEFIDVCHGQSHTHVSGLELKNILGEWHIIAILIFEKVWGNSRFTFKLSKLSKLFFSNFQILKTDKMV